MAITFKEGPELGYIIMCFIVHKTTLELERVILTTLYFVSAENTDSQCSKKQDLQCAFLWTFRWFTHLRSSSPPLVNI
jgi:hypothetical protein